MFNRIHHACSASFHAIGQLWRRAFVTADVVQMDLPDLCALI